MKLAIIIRASGEATVKNLSEMLLKQKINGEQLIVLSENESFEAKMKRSFEKGLTLNFPFTLIIDGDILVTKNFLISVRKLTHKVGKDELGFALKIFDKFYNKPKFRGIHIYKTEWFQKMINLIPNEGSQLRPESFVKEKMLENYGLIWNKKISKRIYGIHDFFQFPADIYYKFLIRAHRSPGDVEKLKLYFLKKKKFDSDFHFALKGLLDGSKLKKISNNKGENLRWLESEPKKKQFKSINVNQVKFILIKKLLVNYLVPQNYKKLD